MAEETHNLWESNPVGATDLELVRSAQQGNTKAFDELVRRYTTRLYKLVYNMTSNHEDTADMLQEIFAKAYRSLQRFMGKSSFYTWIYSISVNMTLNFLKKRSRFKTFSLDDVDSDIQNDPAFVQLTTSPNGPVGEVNVRELQVRLNEAMMKLSDTHRAVVALHDIEGLRHPEIARILGVSAGTVRSRLFYAHQQLQNYLTDFVR